MALPTPEHTEFNAEPFYSLGDKFFVPRAVQLQLRVDEKRRPIGLSINLSSEDTMIIRKIDQLSISQPARSIKEMLIDLFHPREPHPYASCCITPEELRHFQRERRTNIGPPPPDKISTKRVNQLTGSKYTELRKSDRPEQVRQLILKAMQIKIEKALAKLT